MYQYCISIICINIHEQKASNWLSSKFACIGIQRPLEGAIEQHTRLSLNLFNITVGFWLDLFFNLFFPGHNNRYFVQYVRNIWLHSRLISYIQLMKSVHVRLIFFFFNCSPNSAALLRWPWRHHTISFNFLFSKIQPFLLNISIFLQKVASLCRFLTTPNYPGIITEDPRWARKRIMWRSQSLTQFPDVIPPPEPEKGLKFYIT